MRELAGAINSHWKANNILNAVPLTWGYPVRQRSTTCNILDYLPYAMFQQLDGGEVHWNSESKYWENINIEILLFAASDVDADKYADAISGHFDWANRDSGFDTAGSSSIIDTERLLPIYVAEVEDDEFAGIWIVRAEYAIRVNQTL